MASGSSVPEWPTLRVPRTPRALATTSWLVQPAALSTTASPSGPAGAAFGHRYSLVVDLAQDLLDARGAARDVVGLEDQLGRALEPGLAADGGLERVAVLGQRLEHVLVVVRAAEACRSTRWRGGGRGRSRRDMIVTSSSRSSSMRSSSSARISRNSSLQPRRARVVAGGRVLSCSGSLGHSDPPRLTSAGSRAPRRSR